MLEILSMSIHLPGEDRNINVGSINVIIVAKRSLRITINIERLHPRRYEYVCLTTRLKQNTRKYMSVNLPDEDRNINILNITVHNQ